MRILALEPYYGGSHRAYLDGWVAHSRHAWTLLTLPAFKWNWRMRHSAVTFAEIVRDRIAAGEQWDLVFCSDMLDLATFLGLAPAAIRACPSVAYFHENQCAYPISPHQMRDYAYPLTNMSTCIASTRVWFNSEYNRTSFLDGLREILDDMPDYQPFQACESIRRTSEIRPQGIAPMPRRPARKPGPIHVLWAARWEHDKDPGLLFNALDGLKSRAIPFRLSVIGEQFRTAPEVFDTAREAFRNEIVRWGYQPHREDYIAALHDADVIVSTAKHEFFGISVVEAMAAGAFPLVPDRLSYPEILDLESNPDFFYCGDAKALTRQLADIARKVNVQTLWAGDPDRGRRLAARFTWPILAPQLDDALDDINSLNKRTRR